MPLYLLLALLGTQPVLAAPPPSHPSPAEAGQLLGMPSNHGERLAHWGVVEQAIDSNQYTYVEVRTEAGNRWLAVPRTPLTVGSQVRFGNGVKMTNFYSKVLKRTFTEILFVNDIAPQ